MGSISLLSQSMNFAHQPEALPSISIGPERSPQRLPTGFYYATQLPLNPLFPPPIRLRLDYRVAMDFL